jgi:hypothetical protein
MFAGACDICPPQESLFSYIPLVLVFMLIVVGLATSAKWIALLLVLLLALQRLVVIGTVAVGFGVNTPLGLRDAILYVGSFALDPSLLFGVRRLCQPQLYIDDLLAHFIVVCLLIVICLLCASGHVLHVKVYRRREVPHHNESQVATFPEEKGSANKSPLLGILSKRDLTRKVTKMQEEETGNDGTKMHKTRQIETLKYTRIPTQAISARMRPRIWRPSRGTLRPDRWPRTRASLRRGRNKTEP